MKRFTTRLTTIALFASLFASISGCNRKELLSPRRVVDSTVVAGGATAGLVNGQGIQARFNHPFGLTIDAAGNLYIADQGNNVIRKMDASGMVTTFAGLGGISGSANGIADSAGFNKPFSVASDAAGNIYVADAGNNQIGMISQSGMVTRFAGTGRVGRANGTDTSSFNSPLGVAVDMNGNVYVADYGNNLIREINPLGVVSTLAGSGAIGADNGVGAVATFNSPESLTVDLLGNVYVADNGNNMIRKITPTGLVSTFAGSGIAGYADGTGVAASFNSPFGIAVDSNGNVYVADAGNNRIRKITADGIVTTLAGSGLKGAVNATGAAASFNTPSGVAVDALGNVYVADENNNLIRKISSAGAVATVAAMLEKRRLGIHK